MPSLLSISRGAAPSTILRRHLVKKNVFDASPTHRHYHYSHLGSANTCNDGWRLFSSSLNYHYSRRKFSIECLVTRSMSAAAIRNDSSSSNRLEKSSAASSKYQKSTKQPSAADNTDKSTRDNNKQGAADWRAWFSSNEYDDPWSPYRPLLSPTTPHQSSSNKTTAANNSNTNSQTTVKAILTNYNEWERRRHGMNLVPLSLHLNDDSNLHSPPTQHDHNNTNTNTNNEASNTPSQTIKLQKRTQWIDTQTRFTIQMLHDLYYTGKRRQVDRPTMERCHRMIGRLLSLTPRDGNVVSFSVADDVGGGGVGSEVTAEITGAAQRGNAILERMEWCSPAFLPQLRKWQRKQQQLQQGGSGLDFLLTQDSSLEATEPASTTASDYHINMVPKHLIQTKQAIPTPTRAIYNMVLLMYGKEAGSRYVAEQAEDVVWGMIVRGLQLEEFNQSHDIEGTTTKGGEDMSAPLYPSTQNWNCVLQCWSRSSDPNRAFFAYSFFKSWMEWNDSRGKVGVVDEVGASCDLQSFHLMIKSCVVDESTTFDDEVFDSNSASSKKLITQRAKVIGSRVAIGIWRDIRVWKDQNAEITLTSDMYYQLLQALCQTTDRSRGLLAAVAAVFQSCRSDGMETKHITDIVRG
ncbi:hypothetical protein QTG54_005632 [Skeletonema marinoi]|uniref:Uncharacterized protein n=1 Tax=Skeletonema marinoi TaxID=267567 RepID=A0AAD8YFI9_9STRA|nr:hypothetical protein QTG54_005632 [Skeletonema marinoi]